MANSQDKELNVPFEKYQLDNGLDVILHQDKSDPIIAVSILVHVGSNREKPGRTGFAHFFEHMLFQKTENLPQGAFFKNIEALGGTFNGGTWSDGTIYYEVVPKDAIEKVFWMESDRMGYFINAVSVAELEGEKPIVQNEKRQRVDNQPYGHTSSLIKKQMYPKDHPYNWTVIGELEDIQNATIDDVKEFYEQYYGPGNATLVVAGDFESKDIKKMIQKYFGEIKARKEVERLKPWPVKIAKTKSLYHVDNYARLPEIRLTYSTVENFHEDAYALSALGQILSQGKRAHLYKVIVEDKKLAPGASSYQSSSEIAGTFTIRVRANAGVNLTTVKDAIFEALDKFEKEGFSEVDLNKIKIAQETDFYNNISSVFLKAYQLSYYNEFANDPNYISEDIKKIKNVSKEDVMNAYKKYIKGQNYIMTSFVPKGQENLVVAGAEKADIKEEAIEPYKAKELIGEITTEIKKTPSSFDRSIEPPLGEAPLVVPPKVWSTQLKNGLSVSGIEQKELPLVQLSLRIKGGLLVDNPQKIGSANLMTDILMEGTKNKTPEELEDAIGQLGATINMSTSSEYITVTANALAKNFNKVVALIEEILLEPRWDEAEFNRIKQQTLTTIVQRQTNPNAVASNVMNKVLYGEDHILSQPVIGKKESVEKITIDDLKAYYSKNFSPSVSSFNVVGDVSKSEVLKALSSIEKKWANKKVNFPNYKIPKESTSPKIYFVDIPSAKQSMIMIGHLTVKGNEEDFTEINIANNRLGSGGSSRLFQILREEKQFTYGAYSYQDRKISDGAYIAASSVQSNVTKEAVEVFREQLGIYHDTYTADDLAITKNQLIKENTRRFETLGNLLGMLNNITTYDLDADYVSKDQEKIKNISLDRVKEIIKKYINEQNMVYLVVGDKETQMARLKEIGYGDPIELDRYGNKIDDNIEIKNNSKTLNTEED